MAAPYSLVEEIVKLCDDYKRLGNRIDELVRMAEKMEAGKIVDANNARIGIEEDEADNVRTQFNNDLLHSQDTNTSSVGIKEDEEDNVRTPFNNDLILTEIFSLLDFDTLKTIRLVNKQWSRVGGCSLSKRCKTIALCGSKASRNKKDKPYWLRAYEGFEARRKGITQEWAIIFTDYRIIFDNCHGRLPGVLKSSWAENIKVLTITGLSPKEWDFGFTKALLASLPKLKELGFELGKIDGRDSAVAAFSKEHAEKVGIDSGITKVHVEVSTNCCNYDWNIIGFCRELAELSISTQTCFPSLGILAAGLHHTQYDFPFWFYPCLENSDSGLEKEYHSPAKLDVLAKVRKLRKVSLRHQVCWYWDHGKGCCLVQNSLGFVKGLRVSEVELLMPLTTAEAEELVENLDRDVRKLTCQIHRPYYKGITSRFLHALSGQEYKSLEELVIIVRCEEDIIGKDMKDEKVGPILIPSVKTFRIQQLINIECYLKSILYDEEWIIKKLPTAFPNLKSLDLEIGDPTSLKDVLKAVKKLESLEFLKVAFFYLTCSYDLWEHPFFGTSSRRNAYHGFVDLKRLKTLEIVLPIQPSITAKAMLIGFSRMVALERLSISNIRMDEVNEAKAALKILKLKLRRLELIPVNKDEEILSFEKFFL